MCQGFSKFKYPDFKNPYVRNVYIFSLYSLKYFCNKKGGGGPYLVTFVEVPEMFHKVLQYVREP